MVMFVCLEVSEWLLSLIPFLYGIERNKENDSVMPVGSKSTDGITTLRASEQALYASFFSRINNNYPIATGLSDI